MGKRDLTELNFELNSVNNEKNYWNKKLKEQKVSTFALNKEVEEIMKHLNLLSEKATQIEEEIKEINGENNND